MVVTSMHEVHTMLCILRLEKPTVIINIVYNREREGECLLLIVLCNSCCMILCVHMHGVGGEGTGSDSYA